MASYKTLSSSLNWATGLGNTGTTTLVTSSGLGSDCGTLVPHFVNTTLALEQPVVLLSFAQTYNHYLHIMRKMGVNLSKHSGMHFINGLTQNDLSSLPAATRPALTLHNKWVEFFHYLSGLPGCTLILDGLCLLADTQGLEKAVWFFEACQRIVEQTGGRLVVNVYLDEWTEQLVKRLIRRAHYYLAFEALGSGTAAEVSGQLKAAPAHLYCQISAREKGFKPAMLHYKVSDSTVQFFSPGQSRIVL
ncbi:Elongator subunit elp6 [Coemansia sp. RSA 2703]|nr:Elongator subunit elp6 [Coemansia sp. RSA 2703]KAJ2378937.1 Elongator subunit elp6 [Coemansia sp. RSA 2607]